MDYLRHTKKMDGVRAAEATGGVADSMEVRKALILQMDAGELTLAEVQAELARLKRGAKRAGKITRASAYRNA